METASRQAAERSHTTELAQLHLKPTSRWPPDLQRLVEQREFAAAEVSWRCYGRCSAVLAVFQDEHAICVANATADACSCDVA